MVNADEVSQDQLPVITKQVATRLRRLAGEKVVPSNARITLGDSFPVWTLPADKIGSIGPGDPPDLGALAKQSTRWHHLIKVNNKAVAFLRAPLSTVAAKCSLFDSPKVARIDKFLKKNKKARKNLQVRLLVVPGYYVVGLWITDQRAKTTQVLVIDAPASFNLEGQILTSMKFLQALRSQQPITGIHSGGAKTSTK